MENTSTVPSTSAALPLLPVAEEQHRGVGALHRDMWRVFMRAPVWTLLIPALATAPREFLTSVVSAQSPWFWPAFIGAMLVGSLGYFTAVVAVLHLGEHGRVNAADVLRTMRRHLWRFLASTLLAMIAAFTGLLLLVIPFVLVALRVWLLTPALVAENLSVRKSFSRSSDLYKERRALVIGFVGVLLLVYWAPEIVIGMALTGDGMTGVALGFVKLLFAGIMPVIDVLLYVEICARQKYAIPVGVRMIRPVLSRRLMNSGRKELAMAAGISLMLTSMAAGPAMEGLAKRIAEMAQRVRDGAADAVRKAKAERQAQSVPDDQSAP